MKNLIDLRTSFTGSLDKLGMTLLSMGIDRGDPSGFALRMTLLLMDIDRGDPSGFALRMSKRSG